MGNCEIIILFTINTHLMRKKSKISSEIALKPTFQQFQEALNILTHTFLDKNELLRNIIDQLNCLVLNRRQDYLSTPNPTIRKTLINLYKIPQKRQGFTNFFRRVISKIYCYHNNSFDSFRLFIQRFDLPIQSSLYQYQKAIKDIITEIYRKTETIALQSLKGIRFTQLDEHDIKQIQPILMNVQFFMENQTAQTFKRLMKNAYTLQKYTAVSTEEICRFFLELREKVQMRLIEATMQMSIVPQAPPLNSKPQDVFIPQYEIFQDHWYNLENFKQIDPHHRVFVDDPCIWTPQIQQQIIAEFLQHRDLVNVRNLFKAKYEHISSQLIDIARIKRKFIKMIRASIRMLQKFYKKHMDDVQPALPKMIEIDEDKVKLLIGSPYVIKARLCEFYRQPTMSYRSICETINDINQFIREKSLQRFQKSTASKAIIFSL